jgi:hypothetical protein
MHSLPPHFGQQATPTWPGAAPQESNCASERQQAEDGEHHGNAPDRKLSLAVD